MTGRLTQGMRCKIAVWQEAYGSVRQTKRLFNRELGIISAPTRRTIYAIHRKFSAPALQLINNDQEDQGADTQRKTFKSWKRHMH